MSFLFDEVFLYDFDEENLSFKKRFQKPFCIQVIDESDKLLIRSRVNQNNVSDVENVRIDDYHINLVIINAWKCLFSVNRGKQSSQ